MKENRKVRSANWFSFSSMETALPSKVNKSIVQMNGQWLILSNKKINRVHLTTTLTLRADFNLYNMNKTGVINNPLGQPTDSLAISEHCFHFVSFCSIFEKWVWTDGRTTYTKTIPTDRDCGLAEWINSIEVL